MTFMDITLMFLRPYPIVRDVPTYPGTWVVTGMDLVEYLAGVDKVPKV